MFRSTLLVALALAAVPAYAAEKPNTLTPKEIADGWILLFDGETTFGWSIEGEGKVKGGWLEAGGDKETRLSTRALFCDCELHFEFSMGLKKNADLVVRAAKEQLVGAFVSVLCDATIQDNDIIKFAEEVSLGGGKNARGRFDITPQQHQQSRTPISFQIPARTKLLLRNVKLRPLDHKPTFNGKNLTCWKEFPGKKSKFTVTKEGWLNLQNGPGDLQTTGQWDDFVLQLDCISNGKHLNSGVFFRCKPGEYQQGYEAQIRNQFTEKPTQEYTIEEHDPKTHELTGKKKIKSTAVDYGTGAIYRRQPARREVAKDHEWFTMTIVAHGRHMATWVNGIQVTDWTDNRPLSDNARNGCRLEKGAISLQGHDPTTNLSFRRIRIAELPKAAEKK